MTNHQMGCLKTVLTMCLLIFGGDPLRALPPEDDPVRAERLRRQATEAWNREDFATAAKLLQQADDLYVNCEGTHLGDRVIVLRALTWNHVRLGDLEAGLLALETLLELAHEDPSSLPEIRSATRALWEGSFEDEDFESGESLRESTRIALEDGGLDSVADWAEVAVRAERIRNDSVANWRAQQFVEAAKRLQEADALYATIPNEFLADRAVVLRARVFNLALSRDTMSTQGAFNDLVEVVAPHPIHHGEIRQAADAIRDLAMALESQASHTFLNVCQQTLERYALPSLSATIMRFEADRMVADGESKDAIRTYKDCLETQDRLGDDDGFVQTANNLVSLFLTQSQVLRTFDPLEKAFRRTRSGKAPNGQSAVAHNLHRVFHQLAGMPRLTKSAMSFVKRIVDGAVESSGPAVLQADHAARIYAAFLVGQDRKRGPKKAADWLWSLELNRQPPEVTLDLRLRASGYKRASGAPAKAIEWLESLDIPDSLVANHLRARRALLLAECDAALSQVDRFERHGLHAIELFSKIDDFSGLSHALETLIELGDADSNFVVGMEQRRRSLTKPGGRGGLAISTGAPDLSGLGPYDSIYSVSAHNWQVEWLARSESLNGITLKTYGGYFVFESTIPEARSQASGSSSVVTLDELGPYLPVPSSGAYHLLKNGAVRYDPMTASSNR